MTDSDTTTAVHQKDTFTLSATGDAILTRKILPYENTAARFDRVLNLFRETDASVTNLEVLVHDYEPAAAATSGGTYMRAPPMVLDELAEMGINLFSAATNHTFDYGLRGVERTLKELQTRGLVYAGLGENLFAARQPGYLETAAGRVALVSACTSVVPGSEAGEQTAALRGRPGLNPLHVERVYRLQRDRIDHLQKISEAMGFEAIKRDWLDRGLYYNHDWNEPGYFHFKDMKFEEVEEETEEGVVYQVDDDDLCAFREWITEASSNADWVVATIHSHQGVRGLQTTKETPEFMSRVARQCIDAGADVIISTGPHVLRGIEIYAGKPIFYSLGNFIVQNETVTRLPAESYRRYGLSDPTKVSDVFTARFFDDDERPKGDLANEAFWQTVIPTCIFTGDGDLERIVLYPCTLQREQNRPQRGIPALATGEEATAILERVASLSQAFGTEIELDEEVGMIDVG
jgi:poly-gamma-glutamate capsule biosynthesis protein CapA/YwtB (metallophosphatase superfamily)